MFEKEAEEYLKNFADCANCSERWSVCADSLDEYCLANGACYATPKAQDIYIAGAEYGYNKANEWQFVSEKGLPKESGRYLVYVGGGEKGVYPLDFETEYNDFGYWCLIINSASLGVTDTIFETITERNEDKVIAWKEIVLPELKENE